MTNNRYKSKDVQQIALLSVLLLVQILVLTKLVKYDKIKDSIGIHDDSELDVSQPHLEATTELSSNGFSTDFVLGDLNRNGSVDDEDYQLIQEYAKHPENLPEDLYDIADVSEDGLFDVRDVSAFRRKYKIGE